MVVIETDGLYQYIDENGNIYILYPVTKLENVTGTGKLIHSTDGKTLKTLDGTNIAFITTSDLADYVKTSALDDYAKKTDLESYAKSSVLADYAKATDLDSKAPAYTSGTTDLTAGSSALATGTLHFVYE